MALDFDAWLRAKVRKGEYGTASWPNTELNMDLKIGKPWTPEHVAKAWPKWWGPKGVERDWAEAQRAVGAKLYSDVPVLSEPPPLPPTANRDCPMCRTWLTWQDKTCWRCAAWGLPS